MSPPRWPSPTLLPGRDLRRRVDPRPGPGTDRAVLDRRAVHAGGAAVDPRGQCDPVPVPAAPGLRHARAAGPPEPAGLLRVRSAVPDAHVARLGRRLRPGAARAAPPLALTAARAAEAMRSSSVIATSRSSRSPIRRGF